MPEVGSLFVRLKADASEFEQTMQSVSGKFKSAGDSIKGAGEGLSKYVTLPLVGIGTAAIMVGTNFDTQMSRVQALSGGTNDDLLTLRDTALELGRSTQFSATQAAEGMEALALGGLDANQIIAAMPGLLGLAAAEQMGLGSAAGITTAIMNTFGISADQTGTVVDQLLSVSSNAAVSVDEIGQSLQYAGPAAAAAGMSLSDTTAALGLMANQGIKGSQAGTALGAVLSDLTGHVKDGKVNFGDFAVEVYDAQGKMRPFGDILRDIEKGTTGMSDAQRNAALSSVFQRQSLRGVNVLLGEGSTKYDELNKKIVESNGLAATQSTIMQDNLGGAFQRVRSAVEGLLIQLSDRLKPVIMDVIVPAILAFIEKLSGLITWFSNLSPSIQTVVLAVLGIAAAIGPVLVGLGLFITLIGTAIGAIALIASPITLIVLALSGLVLGLIYAYTHFETFRDIVNGAINTVVLVVQTLFPIIVGIITTVFDAVLLAAQTVWPYIQMAISTAITTAQTIIATVLPVIQGLIETAFTAILVIAQAVWPVIQSAVETAVGVIQTVVSTVFPIVQTIVETVFGAVLSLAQQNWPTIQQIIQAAVEIVRTVVETAFGVVRSVSETVFGAVRSIAEAVWPAVRTIVETVMGAIHSVVETVLGIVKSVWDDTHEQLESLARQVWETIQTVIDSILKIILGILQTALGIITGDWQQAWDGIKTIAQGAWDGIKSLIDLAISAIKTIIELGWSAIKNTISTAFDGIKRVVSEGADRVVERMGQLPGEIVSAVGDLGSLLWSAGADLIGGLIDGIVSKIGALKDALGGITNLIPDWKGPAERDRRLLEPSGRLIMQGLDRGLVAGAKGIEQRLGAITGQIAGADLAGIGNGGLGVNFYGPVEILARDRADAARSAGDVGWAVASALRSRGIPR